MNKVAIDNLMLNRTETVRSKEQISKDCAYLFKQEILLNTRYESPLVSIIRNQHNTRKNIHFIESQALWTQC